MIKKYTKKPVEVEAIQLNFGTVQECLKFCGGKINPKNGDFEIQTLEGVMTAQSGDYIIKGLKGEFYPCKPNFFKLTYSLSEKKQSEVKSKLGNKEIQDVWNGMQKTGPNMDDFWYGGYTNPRYYIKPPHLDTSVKESKEQDNPLNIKFQQMVEELIQATK